MKDQYWRMQMHPADSGSAVQHTTQCISRGYIGLDFKGVVGDLTLISRDTLPDGQRDYMDFAERMKKGDFVLIMAHHFPFALVRVTGDYNYIKLDDASMGIWCQHFRKVDLFGYYADWITNAHEWENITMTNTISTLASDTQSGKLIERWLKEDLV